MLFTKLNSIVMRQPNKVNKYFLFNVNTTLAFVFDSYHFSWHSRLFFPAPSCWWISSSLCTTYQHAIVLSNASNEKSRLRKLNSTVWCQHIFHFSSFRRHSIWLCPLFLSSRLDINSPQHWIIDFLVTFDTSWRDQIFRTLRHWICMRRWYGEFSFLLQKCQVMRPTCKRKTEFRPFAEAKRAEKR